MLCRVFIYRQAHIIAWGASSPAEWEFLLCGRCLLHARHGRARLWSTRKSDRLRWHTRGGAMFAWFGSLCGLGGRPAARDLDTHRPQKQQVVRCYWCCAPLKQICSRVLAKWRNCRRANWRQSQMLFWWSAQREWIKFAQIAQSIDQITFGRKFTLAFKLNWSCKMLIQDCITAVVCCTLIVNLRFADSWYSLKVSFKTTSVATPSTNKLASEMV